FPTRRSSDLRRAEPLGWNLVEVAPRCVEMRAFRASVGELDREIRTQFALKREVPTLHVRSPRVGVEIDDFSGRAPSGVEVRGAAGEAAQGEQRLKIGRAHV